MFFSIWLFVFVIVRSAVAVCVNSPDCTVLGYTDTSCSAGQGILRCPFDTGKVRCISANSCEGIGKKTCGDECVAARACCTDTDCGSGQVCDTDDHSCKVKACNLGDIFYSDNTCSGKLNSGKTPIGVVGHITNGGKNGLVVSLAEGSNLEYGCRGTDLSLPSYNSSNTVYDDFNGKSNTEVIFKECSTRPIAASYCKEYSIAGMSGWYLAALGELNSIMYTNLNLVNAGYSKISPNYVIPFNRAYWSSSESYNLGAFQQRSASNSMSNPGKDSRYYVRCVLPFNF